MACYLERDLRAVRLVADGRNRALQTGDGIPEALEGRSRSEPLVDPQLGGARLGDRLGGLPRSEQGTRENEARRRGVRREPVCERAGLIPAASGKRPEVVGVTRIGMGVANEEEEHRGRA